MGYLFIFTPHLNNIYPGYTIIDKIYLQDSKGKIVDWVIHLTDSVQHGSKLHDQMFEG